MEGLAFNNLLYMPRDAASDVGMTLLGHGFPKKESTGLVELVWTGTKLKIVFRRICLQHKP
jgi:hypothetical protein